MACRCQQRRNGPAMESATRHGLPGVVLVGIFASLLLALAPGVASAVKVISEEGTVAGKTLEPRGLAVDSETGRLFVADTGNDRIDVFNEEGNFVSAFGWGVKNGAGELQACTTSCRAGLPGSGLGQFNHPSEIAVDNTALSASRHDIYVVDRGNHRIEKFDSEGHFLLSFGSEGEGEGQFSSAGDNGTIAVSVGPGGVVYVLDDLLLAPQEFKSRLQRFEPSGLTVESQQVLLPVDHSVGSREKLAVDSSGDFYINTGLGIKKYEVGNASPIAEIAEPFEESPGGTFAGLALTIDAENNLFLADALDSAAGPAGVNIIEFNSAAARLRRFGYGSFSQFSTGLAPYYAEPGISTRSSGVYASESIASGVGRDSRVIRIEFPPQGPLVFPSIPVGVNFPNGRASCFVEGLGNHKATLHAEVNPEGKASTDHFEYISRKDFVANANSFTGAHPATVTAESASIGSNFTLHDAEAAASPLVPETEYLCRAIATNADGSNTGEVGTFTTLPPLVIVATEVRDVGPEAATLSAEVNPFGISTTGYFEYVDEATYQADVKRAEEEGKGPAEAAEAGFEHAKQAPVFGEGEPVLEFGEGESPVAKTVVVSGLSPATGYRYRLLASDVLIAPKAIAGPVKSLRTFANGEGALPDDRAYELVSPVQKNSAEMGTPLPSSGLFAAERQLRIRAAARSGEAVTYTSWTSFGAAGGAQASSQYLSKRTPAGWVTQNISPPGSTSSPAIPPYRGFSPDLTFSAFAISEPPLTAEAQTGSENLYLRNDETGAVQALTVQAPQMAAGEGSLCTGYAGSSADGQRAFFAANGAMAGAPVGRGFSLYEWSLAGGLKLVSVLPDGAPAPPVFTGEGANPGVGTGFGDVGSNCTMDQGMVADAVSSDGQIAFWSYGGEYENSKHEAVMQPLFARIDGSETVELDAKPASKAGSGPAGKGVFQGATPDGSKAFFTAPGELTSNATADDLYSYDTQTRRLTDLTPGEISPEGVAVAGISEDGSYAYFTARGALTSEAGPTGEKAVKGAPNLYLWHEGEGLRFIASLSQQLDSGVSAGPELRTSRIAPDGRRLAFLSSETEALSGYDDTIAEGKSCQQPLVPITIELEGDPHCLEAYLYDAEARTLNCVSCNPSGSRPLGPSELPGWTNPYEGPRFLSDDGSKLFFESRDRLSAADVNGKRDVYEWEREGAGSCTSQSPGFDPGTGGCLFLISNGQSTDESYLIDVSSSGADVFLGTRQSLVALDANETYDVYDARAGGGFASQDEPNVPAACEGLEACRSPLSEPLAQLSPGSAALVGPENLAPAPEQPGPKPPGAKPPAKCKKHFVRGRGKCVRRRHAKPKGKRRKHRQQRKAGR